MESPWVRGYLDASPMYHVDHFKSRILLGVKILACIRILRTGGYVDDINHSVQMGRNTKCTYFHSFSRDVTAVYSAPYLKVWPTPCQLCRTESMYADVGFPECSGWVDFCKLTWKNFPIVLKGQYHNSKKGEDRYSQVEACVTGIFLCATGVQAGVERILTKIWCLYRYYSRTSCRGGMLVRWRNRTDSRTRVF